MQMNLMRPDEELCDKLPPPWRALMKSKEKERTKEKIMTEPNKENRSDKKTTSRLKLLSFLCFQIQHPSPTENHLWKSVD